MLAKDSAMKSPLTRTVLLFSLFACGACAAAEPLKSLTVCADPGNMPLSNDKGEGFENKIAQLLGTDAQRHCFVLLASVDRTRPDAHDA